MKILLTSLLTMGLLSIAPMAANATETEIRTAQIGHSVWASNQRNSNTSEKTTKCKITQDENGDPISKCKTM